MMTSALVSVVDWFTLGVYLGVEYHTLKKIEIEHKNNIDRCKIDMLGEWLNNPEEACTKHQLSTALWYMTHSM